MTAAPNLEYSRISTTSYHGFLKKYSVSLIEAISHLFFIIQNTTIAFRKTLAKMEEYALMIFTDTNANAKLAG